MPTIVTRVTIDVEQEIYSCKVGVRLLMTARDGQIQQEIDLQDVELDRTEGIDRLGRFLEAVGLAADDRMYEFAQRTSPAAKSSADIARERRTAAAIEGNEHLQKLGESILNGTQNES